MANIEDTYNMVKGSMIALKAYPANNGFRKNIIAVIRASIAEDEKAIGVAKGNTDDQKKIAGFCKAYLKTIDSKKDSA